MFRPAPSGTSDLVLLAHRTRQEANLASRCEEYYPERQGSPAILVGAYLACMLSRSKEETTCNVHAAKQVTILLAQQQ